MLISWLWLMVENTMVGLLNRALGREIPQGLLRYGTQMIHQESLFFVLPFFSSPPHGTVVRRCSLRCSGLPG